MSISVPQRCSVNGFELRMAVFLRKATESACCDSKGIKYSFCTGTICKAARCDLAGLCAAGMFAKEPSFVIVVLTSTLLM